VAFQGTVTGAPIFGHVIGARFLGATLTVEVEAVARFAPDL
jgi:hypothetical protein